MKERIHPQLNLIKVTDGAGRSWNLLSVSTKDIHLNSSRENHPAWTQTFGSQKSVNSARVNKINEFFE